MLSFIGNFFKVVLALAMMLAVVAAGLFIFSTARFNFDFGPSASGSTGNGQAVLFTIQPGESVATVADNLKKEGLIDSTTLFRLRLKVKDADDKLKAGRFQLRPGTDMDSVIATLTTAPADIGARFTVIEGTRIGEIAEKLATDGLVDAEKFKAMAGTPEGAATFADDFLNTSGKPADQGLEGYLFPDTYEIKQGEGDNSEVIISKMLGTLEEKITPEMRKVISDRQLDMHQVLTIASIVQREGQVKEELPVISAVFWNRISNSMRLDADPTTQYALGKPGDWWPTLNLDPNTVDNPYNTYHISGMPPGPICNPGLDALQAAVNPAQNDYLFFVARNDCTGCHAFAKTLEEHERNRRIYGNK